MKNGILATVAAFLAIGFAATTVQAQRNQDWELLGRQTVSMGVDRDVIKVGRDEGRFNKIQLRVKDNAIEVLDVKVVYGNGKEEDIRVRENIRAEGQTRAIDLKGAGDRVIRRVELVYRSKPNVREQATVELWGKG